MQVYLVHDTRYPYPEYPVSAFRNFGDIERSLRISYSACSCVDIKCSPQVEGGPVFTVTGFLPIESLDASEEPFTHTIKVTRLPVWDSPTHI